MLFSQLSLKLQAIEATSKRLEMTRLLADLYGELGAEEIRQVSYLLQGKLVPKYEPKEFQISTKMVIRILSRFIDGQADQEQQSFIEHSESSINNNDVDSMYKKKGDLGDVAEEILRDHRSNQNGNLNTKAVFDKLFEIAEESGEGSQERKVGKSVELLSQLDPLSAKYVVRIILGKLRLGFSDMTLIDAFSWSLKGDKSLSAEIEAAYQKRADIGYIAETLFTKGETALHSVKVVVGTPIIPALCQRLNTAEEIIEKMTEVYAEPKYDGTRVQIHVRKTKGKPATVRTYTRNLEESSAMFPELVKAVEVLNCNSCILDAEAVGYDAKTQKLLLFQQTMKRKRKHGIEEATQSVPLHFFVFDILAKDGESLIDVPLEERKTILEQLFKDDDVFVQAPMIRTSDATELHEYHEAKLAEGLEGVVIKMVNGTYQSGRKGYSWVKIKEAEGNRGKLNDTVDCIVMGYYLARGQRTQFGVGAALVGVLNEQEEIVTISKVGSGFSEQLAKQFIQKVKNHEVSEKPSAYQVSKLLIPDVWIEPSIVIEVAADELTVSPSHSAGIALRFPRLIKFREDKSWQQATSLNELKKFTVG